MKQILVRGDNIVMVWVNPERTVRSKVVSYQISPGERVGADKGDGKSDEDKHKRSSPHVAHKSEGGGASPTKVIQTGRRGGTTAIQKKGTTREEG